MNTKIRYLLDVYIRYGKHKKINFLLSWENRESKKRLVFSVYLLGRIPELIEIGKSDLDEWFWEKRKYKILWKNY
jgi:hypothetical protein